jgi:hypothetical protein
LGKGLAGESATQRATKVAAGGFPVAGGYLRTIELKPRIDGEKNQTQTV